MVVVAVHAFVFHEHFCHGGWRKTVPVHQILSGVARRVVSSVVPLAGRIQAVRNISYRLHLRQICRVGVCNLPRRPLRKKRRNGRKFWDVVSAAGEVDIGGTARPVPELRCPVFTCLGAEVAQIYRVKHLSLCTPLPTIDRCFGFVLQKEKIWEGEMTRNPSKSPCNT